MIEDAAPSPHRSVMLGEVLEALAPRAGETHVDMTFGAGGYARAILAAADCAVIAFDRDPAAIDAARALDAEAAGRFRFAARPFAELEAGLEEAGAARVDGVVFDLGVSSMQLDQAERGFSFLRDGPLSMRMDGGAPDAADIVNTADAADLARIFHVYGEERFARRIAAAIVRARAAAPIMTTLALASVVADAQPRAAASRIHPATRVFQALRIHVNDELRQLAAGLVACERVLRPGGRLVAVSFHSLEDRIVKRFLSEREDAAGGGGSRHAPPATRSMGTFRVLTRKAVRPTADEATDNPRARSARLRAAVRTGAPAASVAPDDAISALAPPLGLAGQNQKGGRV